MCVGGGVEGVGGRGCGIWLGRVLYLCCPTESVELPFEERAIVILIFHKRKCRQKRLNNLPQVLGAVIITFFKVARQNFLSWH